MVSQFTEQQRRMLDLILRLSWGCGHHSAFIPKQKDFEIVGIGEGHIKAHLDWLIQAKVILRNGNYYSFNKDFDQWRVSRAFKYNPEQLSNLIHLNIETEDEKLTENGSPKLTENGSLEKDNLRKTEEKTSVKGKFVTSESASPKESIKESNIYINNTKEIYKEIFNFWNSKKIVVHDRLTDKRETAIRAVLRDHSKDQVLTAISNYEIILRDETYFFKHEWTLEDFLRRGLEKFLDLDRAKRNYKRDKKSMDLLNNSEEDDHIEGLTNVKL